MAVYRVTVNGNIYEVSIEDPFASPVVATVNGTTYTVDLAALTPASAEVPAAPVSVVPAAAEEPPLPASIASPAAVPAPAAQPDVPAAEPRGSEGLAVVAPMPGKVLAIAVKEGQLLSRGDEVATLEAMKMAMVVRAPGDGAVCSVLVTPGQAVRAGETLVVLV
ncbi:MAG: biotin/lipoyl-containing protein [Chloroflexota bacterium]